MSDRETESSSDSDSENGDEQVAGGSTPRQSHDQEPPSTPVQERPAPGTPGKLLHMSPAWIKKKGTPQTKLENFGIHTEIDASTVSIVRFTVPVGVKLHDLHGKSIVLPKHPGDTSSIKGFPFQVVRRPDESHQNLHLVHMVNGVVSSKPVAEAYALQAPLPDVPPEEEPVDLSCLDEIRAVLPPNHPSALPSSKKKKKKKKLRHSSMEELGDDTQEHDGSEPADIGGAAQDGGEEGMQDKVIRKKKKKKKRRITSEIEAADQEMGTADELDEQKYAEPDETLDVDAEVDARAEPEGNELEEAGLQKPKRRKYAGVANGEPDAEGDGGEKKKKKKKRKSSSAGVLEGKQGIDADVTAKDDAGELDDAGGHIPDQQTPPAGQTATPPNGEKKKKAKRKRAVSLAATAFADDTDGEAAAEPVKKKKKKKRAMSTGDMGVSTPPDPRSAKKKKKKRKSRNIRTDGEETDEQ